MKKGRPENSIIGERFHRLVAIKRIRTNRLIFKCDCGVLKSINKYKVVHGEIKSCGCLYHRHGLLDHSLHGKWRDMKQRCNNPKCKAYKNYGANGVKVCEEWANDFIIFYNWSIQNGWQEGLTIDRIDNDGNYEPSNCQFISLSENTAKTSRRKLNEIAVKVIKYYLQKGVHFRKLAKYHGVNPATIWQIQNNQTWKSVTI